MKTNFAKVYYVVSEHSFVGYKETSRINDAGQLTSLVLLYFSKNQLPSTNHHHHHLYLRRTKTF